LSATDDWKQTDHLLALEGAKNRLRLFEADLMVEGSFDSAIVGCDGVFHTACPVNADVKEPQVQFSSSSFVLCFLLFLRGGGHVVSLNAYPCEERYSYA